MPSRKSTSRLIAPALVCLALGLLGGIAAALITEPEAAEPVRFTPPREPPPTFRLRNQDGAWRTPADARGDVLVVSFLYSTCRGLCPRQAAEIKDAVLAAGGGVTVYGISVDPVGDTPERAKAFLKRLGVEGGPVHFLLGSRRELRPVWARFGIVPIGATEEEAAQAAAEYQPMQRRRRRSGGEIERPAPPAALEPYPASDDGRYRGRPRHRAGLDFEHTAYVLVVDKRGRQRVGYPFEQLTSELLLEDLRVLKAEA